MSKYQLVVGLEVHIELNTKTKMFCRCSTDYYGVSSSAYFGKAPNAHTCPICLGLPGSLPYTNSQAIKDCIKIGLALNCRVEENSRFERKNYFYPDLPKGYQISQYRWPLCKGGWIKVAGADGKVTKIRINRVHQEEDTAKLMHQFGTQKSKVKSQNEENNTYIDFNRSSVPLVEIVTEPDFHDPSEVKDYAKKLQQIFRYLGVSNADMEKGDMRLEANVSLRPEGSDELPPYRIELKNINSFNFMVAAINYEINRQSQALDKGEKLTQETRGWNQVKKETFLQRSKEEAHDYRYFPDPDLPGLNTSDLDIEDIRSELPELPQAKTKRFVQEYGISAISAAFLVESQNLADYFEKVVKLGKGKSVEPNQIANFLINQKVDINEIDLEVALQKIASKSVGIIDDQAELEKIAQEVITENPQMVEQYHKGKITVIQALIGGVMRKTAGKANPGKVKEILVKKLE